MANENGDLEENF